MDPTEPLEFCLSPENKKDDIPITVSGKDAQNIHIGAKLKKGDRVFTKDGVKTTKQYVEEEHTEEVTKDARDTRSAYLEETNRDKKMRRHQKRVSASGKKGRRPLIDSKEQFDDTSFVKHLTEEDLKMEELQKIREKHWREYGSMIDDNIIDLVTEHVKLKKRGEKSPLKMTQLMECALLALTKGPADLKGIVKRLDTALEQSQTKIKFRFTDVMPKFTETLRRIVRADPEKQWLRKYLIIDGNGVFGTSKYEFPPPMMQIAAQYPSRMKEGWMMKLPKGTVPFTEEQLLKELPILRDMVVTDVPHHGTSSDQNSNFDMNKRIHDNEGNRRKLFGEIRDTWLSVDDVTKIQLWIGLMACSDSPTGLNKTWISILNKFIQDYKNPHTYKHVSSGELSSIKNKLRSGKVAAGSLILREGKTTDSSEVGVIPEAASICFSDIRKMTVSRGTDKVAEGFLVLKSICEKNENIDRHVNPKKYENEPIKPVDSKDADALEQTPDFEDKEETEDKSVGDIIKDGVDRISPDTSLLDGLEIVDEEEISEPHAVAKLANAVSDIAQNGIEINFNIGFGRFERKSDQSNLIDAINQTNNGLDVAIGRMELMMASIDALVKTIKK